MKNRTIKLNQLYSIKIQVSPIESNENPQFASLYKKDIDHPILSTSFKKTDSNETIKEKIFIDLQTYLQVNKK